MKSSKKNNCELLDLYSFLGKKWAFPLFSIISFKPITFNQLQLKTKHIVNPTLLSKRLKEMQRLGLIKKAKSGNRLVYTLTKEGDQLKELLHQVRIWSEKCGYAGPRKCKLAECVCEKVFRD